MKKIHLLFLFVLLSLPSLKAPIAVDKSGTYLITKKDGKPFFWLGVADRCKIEEGATATATPSGIYH